jgi:hypothetical protein
MAKLIIAIIIILIVIKVWREGFIIKHQPPLGDLGWYQKEMGDNIDVSRTALGGITGQGITPGDPYYLDMTMNKDYDWEGKTTYDYVLENQLFFSNQILESKWGPPNEPLGLQLKYDHLPTTLTRLSDTDDMYS